MTSFLFIIRKARPDDASDILALYRRVARVPGGLARLEHEIDAAYVNGFVVRAQDAGIELLAIDAEHGLVGEIHASPSPLHVFSHVLTDLTIAVDPIAQGRGVGRRLFEALLDQVRTAHPEILRVELIASASNRRAISLYTSLGFQQEGEMRGRIRTPEGGFEADIPMAWHRS